MTKKVGILYSPGYGAGWSTWGDPDMALDQELVQAIAAGKHKEDIHFIALKNWPNEYMGGLDDLQVEWVDEGTAFRIKEYDGYESIEYGDNTQWLIAK